MNLLIVLILGIVALMLAVLIFLILKPKTEASAENQLIRDLGEIKNKISELKSKFVETTGGVNLFEHIAETKSIIKNFKTEFENRKKLDESADKSIQHIMNVLAGSRSRGISGERVLEEALKQFPNGMVDYNFRVRGKPVEYALILANNKRLPIDSKWPAMDLLAELNEEPDLAKKQDLEEEVERQLLRKVREVTQYIDPATTLPFALAAVPDSVFAVCKKAHIEAFKNQVILMPYSITIPYILAIFRLHLQYSRSIDLENLEGYLSQIESHLNKIDQSLENSVSRGATMVSNAYTDCKKYLGEIRGSLASLKSLPEKKENPPLIE